MTDRQQCNCRVIVVGRKSCKPARGRPITLLLSLPMELGYRRAWAAAAAAWLWWQRTVSLSSRSLLLRCCGIAAINEMYKRPAFFGQTASVFVAPMLPKEFQNNGTPFFFKIKKNANFDDDRMTDRHTYNNVTAGS